MRRGRLRNGLLVTLGAALVLGTLPVVAAIAAGVARLTKSAASHSGKGAATAPANTASVPTPSAGTPAPAGVPTPESQPPVASGPAPGPASVGVLAHGPSVQGHRCTASVVASRNGNVILTAAHCVAGSGQGLVFAPGYQQGTAPYGTRDVQSSYVDPAWLGDQDQDADVAFLVVTPSAANPTAQPVQSVVGGFELAAAPAPNTPVRVTGYVSGAPDPVVCATSVYLTAGFPSFDCDGFAGGTSGGPWVTAAASGTAQVSGVIGGLHEGGCVVSTSYSTRFTPSTVALLARADTGADPDTVPANTGDGC